MIHLTDEFRARVTSDLVVEEALRLGISEPACTLGLRCAGICMLARISVLYKQHDASFFEWLNGNSADQAAEILFENSWPVLIAGVSRFAGIQDTQAARLVQVSGGIVQEMLREIAKVDNPEAESFWNEFIRQSPDFLGKVPGYLTGVVGVLTDKSFKKTPGIPKRMALLLFFLIIVMCLVFIKHCL